MQSLKIQISYQEENGLFSSLFSSLSKKERLLHCFYGEELPSPNISVIALPDTNCSFLVPSPSLGFLPNNPRPLQVLVSRLSSIQRFSPSQMLRQKLQNSSGRLHVQPLWAGLWGGEIWNLPFKRPSVLFPPSPWGSFQLVHKSGGNWQQQIRSHKSLGRCCSGQGRGRAAAAVWARGHCGAPPQLPPAGPCPPSCLVL